MPARRTSHGWRRWKYVVLLLYFSKVLILFIVFYHFFLDAISSSSSYPCQWASAVGQWVIHSFSISELCELVINININCSIPRLPWRKARKRTSSIWSTEHTGLTESPERPARCLDLCSLIKVCWAFYLRWVECELEKMKVFSFSLIFWKILLSILFERRRMRAWVRRWKFSFKWKFLSLLSQQKF